MGEQLATGHTMKLGFSPILLFSLWIIFGGVLKAEPAAETSAGDGSDIALEMTLSEIRLTLRQALLLSLRKNLSLQATRLTPQILQDEIEQAESVYDSVLTSQVNRGTMKQETISQLAGTEVSRQTKVGVDLSARRRLLTGTQLVSTWENSRDTTNSVFLTVDPSYRSRLGLRVVQPLLKGRGVEVNRGPIRIAENRASMSALEFRQAASDTLAQAEEVYWDLVFSQENLKVQQASRQQAQAVVEETRQRAAVGSGTENDVMQAEAEAAEREEFIILVEQEVRNSEDRLKILTNLIENPEIWDTRIVPLTSPPTDPVTLDADTSVDEAFRNRPDYLSQRKDLENRDIAVVLARNGRYPELNLSASLAMNGLTRSYGGALDSLSSTDFYDWEVGISVEFPIGLRSGRSLSKRRQSEKAQALLRFKDFGNQVVAEVRDATRSADAAWKRIQTTESARKFREAKLASEEELYRAGRSTANDLLEVQVDLARARTQHLRARLTWRKALVSLEEARGTLLASRGVESLGLAEVGEENPASDKP